MGGRITEILDFACNGSKNILNYTHIDPSYSKIRLKDDQITAWGRKDEENKKDTLYVKSLEIDAMSLERKRFSNIAAVYFLFQKDRVVYVGQTENLYFRLNAHRKDKRFDSYAFQEEYDFQKRIDIECFNINKYKPKYNVAFSKTKMADFSKNLANPQ